MLVRLLKGLVAAGLTPSGKWLKSWSMLLDVEAVRALAAPRGPPMGSTSDSSCQQVQCNF